jgi:hypothetical protein
MSALGFSVNVGGRFESSAMKAHHAQSLVNRAIEIDDDLTTTSVNSSEH